MLKNTFCHIPGVGPQRERMLWAAGVRSWEALAEADRLPVSPGRAELLRERIAESVDQLADGNAAYFQEHLPAGEQWRMFPEFSGSAAFLDIETTGLGAADDYVTAICLYDGRRIRHYVQDDNLPDFRHEVRRYSLLITYNGKAFDVPFLRRHLGVRLTQAHIDLRHVLASLGCRGGLKGCERRFGLDRGNLAEVDGYFAVLLWWDYHNNGNARALETLLAYNALDTVNLAALMPLAYNLKLAGTPFEATCRLPVPTPPEIPFRADAETIRRIAQRYPRR